MLLGILNKFKKLITPEEEKARDFMEVLKNRFGLKNVLFLTSEGLPIVGTFEDLEITAAKVPELIKHLKEVKEGKKYNIEVEGTFYHILVLSPDVIFFAEGTKPLKEDEFSEIVNMTMRELGI